MVRVGNFSVQLVDATSKHPFKEHATPRNDEVFVEVEPNVEYYVKVQNHSFAQDASFTIRVDGLPLRYRSPLNWGKGKYKGLWNKQMNGVSSHCALKFGTATRQRQQMSSSSPTTVPYNHSSNLLGGQVVVKIYDGPFYSPCDQFISTFDGANNNKVATAIASNGVSKKKVVQSVDGKTIGKSDDMEFEALVHPSINEDAVFLKYGKRTITLNYCTTLGLIHAGILPQPQRGVASTSSSSSSSSVAAATIAATSTRRQGRGIHDIGRHSYGGTNGESNRTASNKRIKREPNETSCTTRIKQEPSYAKAEAAAVKQEREDDDADEPVVVKEEIPSYMMLPKESDVIDLTFD